VGQPLALIKGNASYHRDSKNNYDACHPFFQRRRWQLPLPKGAIKQPYKRALQKSPAKEPCKEARESAL